jgi:hypothetical protein
MSWPNDRPIASLIAVLSGVPDAAANEWVRDGLTRWIERGGTIPLDGCLGLPSAGWRTLWL